MRWVLLRLSAPALVLALASALEAQQPQPGLPLPRIDTVFPCGAKIGTSVEVTVAGPDTEEPESLIFSHPGIKAELVPLPTPDPKAKNPPPKKGPPPQRKFKVTVAPDVPPGNHDLRLVNKWGVSNPRAFVVGDLNEVLEKEPNNDVPEAQKVELNSTVTGTIAAPTDVDYYAFAARRGQRVLVSCLASSIDSRARPAVEVYDAKGRRLAFNRNYNGYDALADFVAPDDGDYLVRLTEFTYTAGSPQHFYRLSITTAPWIDAVFPPMVEAGKPAQVTLYGRNLPGGSADPAVVVDGRPLEKLQVTITPPAEPAAAQKLAFRGHVDPRMSGIDGFEYRLKGPAGSSNPVLIGLAREKVLLDKEPNDKPDAAQEIAAPCEVAGRIDKRSDRDWYAINAKKGEVLWFELIGDRMGVPSDYYLTVRDAATNKDVIELDDATEPPSQQFYTRNSDPPGYKFVAPADGRYLLGVGSREAAFLFGPRSAYRLRVAPPKPDFRLVVMPASDTQPDAAVLRADGNQYYDVFVWRQDGFNGPIALTAENLPPGVTCPPNQFLSAGYRQGTLVLTAAPSATPFTGTIVVKGTANLAGQPLVREARPATITWTVPPQQGIPTISRLDQSLVLAVRDKAPFRVTAEPENAFVKPGMKLPQPLMVKQGEKLTVPFKVARISPDAAKSPITLQQVNTFGQNPQQAPLTVNNGQPLPPVAPDKKEGTFVIDVKTNAQPGTYTVVLRAQTQMPVGKDPAGKDKKPVPVVFPSTPVTVIVLPNAVAKLSLAPKGNLKQGEAGEVTVKVDRQFEYAGDFKVKLVLPPNAKGISAEEVTIPAGKDEAKLVLKVAPDAPAGQLQNLVVQATATVEGKVPVVHEAKFNVNVEKAPPPKKK